MIELDFIPEAEAGLYADTEFYTQSHQQDLDRLGLIRAGETFFPEMVAINLTQNTYRMVSYYGATTLGTPQEGLLTAMLDLRLANVAPEDQTAFRDSFYPEVMRQEFGRGRDRIQLIYRRIGADGIWHWMETMVVRQENPYGDDLLAFAVSRNVDEQKQQEKLLQEALAQATDKLDGWLYYNSLSNQSHPGLVYVNYNDGRMSPYSVGMLAQRLDCTARELAMSSCFRICSEDKNAVQQAHEKAKQLGEETFHAEYRVKTAQGKTVWVNNHAVPFRDKHGDTGYIHFLTDTTHEHTLMDQVRLQMEERLAENEKIFDIAARHSDRMLCYYDLASRRAHPWNEENCEHCNITHICLKKYSLSQFGQGGFVMSGYNQIEATRMMREIHEGIPYGEATFCLNIPEVGIQWLEFKYSGLYKDGKPVAALISFKDVTKIHENELAQLRLTRTADEEANLLGYLEVDLDMDFIEKHIGRNYLNGVSFEGRPYSEYWRAGFKGLTEEQRADFMAQYKREYLLEQFHGGIQRVNRVWKIVRNEGELWVRIIAELVRDPYNGHTKAFARLMDVTTESETQLAMRKQAEYEEMTGFLRRGVGEARIREYMAAHTQPGGILIALDLDDLKGINDTFGHAAGDTAIIGIAETIKGHFRKDDILIRAGGDEFLVFLPGAAKDISSIELSMKELMRKLSMITVGENGERSIYCSIGCAAESPDNDTFDSLYQRADIALYHVKRNGKNSFAFFEPEMMESKFRYQANRLTSVVLQQATGEGESKNLLEAMSFQYPGIVSFNLTKNQFHVLSVGGNVMETPPSGKIEEFLAHWSEEIHSDDRENILFALSINSLLALHAQGKPQIKYYYRNRERIGFIRTEIDVRIYQARDGDIRAFLLFRWDSGSQKDMELQHLNRLLINSDIQKYEYVCLIDIRDKSCSVFSHDGENSHAVPNTTDFDNVTKHIRDTQITPEQRDAYYKNAVLEQVLDQMSRNDDKYAYRYTMLDGITREARFSWYDRNRTDLLLMTVHKVQEQD